MAKKIEVKETELTGVKAAIETPMTGSAVGMIKGDDGKFTVVRVSFNLEGGTKLEVVKADLRKNEADELYRLTSSREVLMAVR